MKNRKGLALPIEMIVIVAIAVLVLVVIAAFFVGGVGRLGAVGDGSAFGTGCDRLRTLGCTASPNSVGIENYGEPARSAYDGATLGIPVPPQGEKGPASATGTLLRACYNLNRIILPHPSLLDSDAQCRIACGCPA
jgi:hypothetical protein